MAVGRQVSLEEYLHRSYRPDCDYVDGEVQERHVGEREHGGTQREILFYLAGRYPNLREQLIPGQRVQVKPTRFRVPDVCVSAEGTAEEQIMTTPPILCIEILSPEDRRGRYLERVNDFFEMGVPSCWIIDPAARRAWVATPGRLDEATAGILRSGDLEMPLTAVLK